MARNPGTNNSGGSFDEATIEAVWQKGTPEPGLTSYRKDKCGASMQRSRHGKTEQYGWEIDHSRPRSQGGTDHLNNLYAAHTVCNRSKQARPSASVRKENGHSHPPRSAAAMEELKAGDAWVGALSIGLLGARFLGPPGFLIGAVVGAIGAYAVDRGRG